MPLAQSKISAVSTAPEVLLGLDEFFSDWDQSRPSSELIAALHAQFPTSTPALAATQLKPDNPVGKRGKSMSRRRGQRGYIEKSGRWWVVKVWEDVPGQETRSHVSHRICPISGPGSLNKSERRRRADEIIAELGINSEARFNAIVQPMSGARGRTFREQGEIRLNNLRTRLRNPAAEGSIINVENYLRLYLNPILGDMPLSEIYSPQLRLVVRDMVERGRAPSTITSVVTAAIGVMASAVDPKTGEALYPRRWNPTLIDLPVVDKDKMNTPDFPREILTGLAAYENPRLGVLFQFLAAGGPRISEALGIEIDKHISSDFRTITIEQQASGRKVLHRVKKPASRREIDIHPDIAAVLREFAGDRTSGFLFCTRNGTALDRSFVLIHLYKALKGLGYTNPHTGDSKAGNHAFRRSRDTYLRNETGCPEGIYKLWLGHSFGRNMSELYDKVKRNKNLRREWAERCGYNFDLPLSPYR